MTAPVTPTSLRQTLGHFATGVTIITAVGADGQRVGLTASSFNSLSLEPPLVLWSLGLSAGSLPAFRACTHFAVHVLQAHQQHLAERFSKRMPDRFEGLSYQSGLGSAPVLDDVPVVLECTNLRQYTEGDHLLFIGQVERLRSLGQSQPLLYHGGRFFTEMEIQPSA
jgi:flavin reductase (DIM6/NTAB) family NADH-FMN oxidoreductase RutF